MSVAGVLEVRDCPHGRGVFATREFKAGDLIRTMEVAVTTTPKSPPWKRWALIVGRTAEGKHLFWDELPEGSRDYWSNFLDHSDQPNVRFMIDLAQKSARLVATRSVGVGEELLLDYKEYDADNWTPG